MKRMIMLALVFASLTACLKEQDCLDRGVITGGDPRDCMCCGGWFVVIRDTTWRFDQVPEDCTIDLVNETFPLPVRLQWTKKIPQCMGDEIVVKKLIRD